MRGQTPGSVFWREGGEEEGEGGRGKRRGGRERGRGGEGGRGEEEGREGGANKHERKWGRVQKSVSNFLCFWFNCEYWVTTFNT